jgi:cytochrome c553
MQIVKSGWLLPVFSAALVAGRSPSHLVRQLYDFKTGARNGTQAVLMKPVLMKPVVARLTAAQMTDVAAYVATLPRAGADRH